MKHAIRLVAVLAFLTAGVTIAAAQSQSRDDHRRQSEKSNRIRRRITITTAISAS